MSEPISIDPSQSLTLGDVAREHRRRFPRQTAVVCHPADVRLTYSELDERSNKVANMLLASGCGPGSNVAWLGQNCHRVLELLLGCAKIGAALCPVNWRGSAHELRFVLRDLQPALVVWQEEEIGDTVAALRHEAGSLTTPDGLATSWMQHDTSGEGSYEAAVAAAGTADPGVAVDPFATVLVIYTGAFEGRPHPAGLHHISLTTRALCEALWRGIDHRFAYLNNGPMFHVGNWRTLMPTFLLGGKNVFVRRVDAELMCRLVEEERCNGAYLLPITRAQMEAVNADRRYDLRSLRDGGGSDVWRSMVAPGPSYLGYGQTETGGVVATTAFGPEAEGGNGRPIPLVQMRMLDEDGRDVPDGEIGEIAVRGLTVGNGYLNRPELSTRRFSDGWWRTGDLGRREPDGSVTFVGPKTRMLKSAAENIYPVEVERCLATHPSVADCAVIGVPDPQWHQSVKAIVVLAEGATADPDDLIEFCRDRIASYKKPRFVEFASSLPRRGGQVDYDALDARYGGGNYPGDDQPSGDDLGETGVADTADAGDGSVVAARVVGRAES